MRLAVDPLRAAELYVLKHGGPPSSIPPPPLARGVGDRQRGSSKATARAEPGAGSGVLGVVARGVGLSISSDTRSPENTPGGERRLRADTYAVVTGLEDVIRGPGGGPPIKYATLPWMVEQLVTQQETNFELRRIVSVQYRSFASAQDVLEAVIVAYDSARSSSGGGAAVDAAVPQHQPLSITLRPMPGDAVPDRVHSTHAASPSLSVSVRGGDGHPCGSPATSPHPSSLPRSSSSGPTRVSSPAHPSIEGKHSVARSLAVRTSDRGDAGRRSPRSSHAPGGSSCHLRDGVNVNLSKLRVPLKVLSFLQVWLKSPYARRDVGANACLRERLSELLDRLEAERLGARVTKVRELCFGAGDTAPPLPPLVVAPSDPLFGEGRKRIGGRGERLLSIEESAERLGHFTAREIAEELTRAISEQLSSLSDAELLDKAWMAKAPGRCAAGSSGNSGDGGGSGGGSDREQQRRDAPTITDITDRYNVMSRWVQSVVLVGTGDAEDKARKVRGMIEVAEELLALNNFLCLSAVVQGIHPKFSVLLQFRSMWSRVRERDYDRLLTLHRHCAFEENYAAYRQQYGRARDRAQPRIPFLPAVLKDLAALYDGTERVHRQRPALIHVRKFAQIDVLLEDLRQAQKCLYVETDPRTGDPPAVGRGAGGFRGSVDGGDGVVLSAATAVSVPTLRTAAAGKETGSLPRSRSGSVHLTPHTSDGGDGMPAAVGYRFGMNAELQQLIDGGLRTSLSTVALRDLALRAETANLERQVVMGDLF